MSGIGGQVKKSWVRASAASFRSRLRRTLRATGGALGSAEDLVQCTRGTGTCSIEFDHFRPVDRDDDRIAAHTPARVVPPLPRRESGIELDEPDDVPDD